LVDNGSVEFGGGGARLGAALRMDYDEGVAEAVDAARGADVAIICTGLNVRTSIFFFPVISSGLRVDDRLSRATGNLKDSIAPT
jgi:hypothetical protein